MAAAQTSERLSERELKAISAHAITRNFPAGTVVLSEGDATNSLYVVLSGRVKIFLADPAGREIVLGQAGAGGYFGEMTLDGGPRSASSVVTEEATQQDIAARIGASREMVSRILKELVAGGYIRIEARRIVIAKTLPQGW